MESQRPVKKYIKQKASTKSNKKRSLSSSSEEHDNSQDSNIANASDASSSSADVSYGGNLANFLKTLLFETQEFASLNSAGPSQNASNHKGVVHPYSSPCVNILEKNIRVLSIPSRQGQIVLLEPPTSLTLHGYVKVTVSLGKVCIYGYEMKEGESITVFSTEGTGLKKVVALNSVHKSTIEVFKTKLQKFLRNEDIDIEEFTNTIQPETVNEDIDIEEFINTIHPKTVAIIIEKTMFPPPLQILELYYPHAVQTKLPRDEKIRREEKFELCSTDESYAIDISDDFKIISEKVNQMIIQPVPDGRSGCRILVEGEKSLGKSTLIRYLMNSSLKKRPMFFFLDADLDQAEYTPPGVVSLFKVTKPLLGPSFAHQQKPLLMVFVGSVSPVTFPELYERSVVALMKYFDDNFGKHTLFVNTMGWRPGVMDLCLQSVRVAVKPTVVITLVPPDPNLSLKMDVAEVTNFVVPSKVPPRESDAPCYSDMDMRNFNLLAYLGQCHRPYMPISPINAYHGSGFTWNRIAVHMMGKKVSPSHLVKTVPCSMVALCCVDPSCMVTDANPELPKTLCDDLIHKCLGFGFVKPSDDAKRVFQIVTPLMDDELENVNAFITGQIAIPAAIFLKQTIKSEPDPTRVYLGQFMPFLFEGLLKIIYVRPEDPIQYLADWMITFKEAFYKRLMNG